MSGPGGEACFTCYFCVDPNADIDERGYSIGWCHRYPPARSKIDAEAPSDLVVMVQSEVGWCGEWRQHPDRRK